MSFQPPPLLFRRPFSKQYGKPCSTFKTPWNLQRKHLYVWKIRTKYSFTFLRKFINSCVQTDQMAITRRMKGEWNMKQMLTWKKLTTNTYLFLSFILLGTVLRQKNWSMKKEMLIPKNLASQVIFNDIDGLNWKLIVIRHTSLIYIFLGQIISVTIWCTKCVSKSMIISSSISLKITCIFIILFFQIRKVLEIWAETLKLTQMMTN